jgi:hypothetical protein
MNERTEIFFTPRPHEVKYEREENRVNFLLRANILTPTPEHARGFLF